MRVKYQQSASKNMGHGCVVTALLKASNTFQGPGEGVPPDDHVWEEGVAAHLDASWDNLIFVWVVISCTVWEHWGEVAIAINGDLLGMDPIHQEEARESSSFLVPVKVVDHSGHTLPLTVDVRDKSGCFKF